MCRWSSKKAFALSENKNFLGLGPYAAVCIQGPFFFLKLFHGRFGFFAKIVGHLIQIIQFPQNGFGFPLHRFP